MTKNELMTVVMMSSAGLMSSATCDERAAQRYDIIDAKRGIVVDAGYSSVASAWRAVAARDITCYDPALTVKRAAEGGDITLN